MQYNINKKYFILECPTGGGKSAIALPVSKILNALFNDAIVCGDVISILLFLLKVLSASLDKLCIVSHTSISEILFPSNSTILYPYPCSATSTLG